MGYRFKIFEKTFSWKSHAGERVDASATLQASVCPAIASERLQKALQAQLQELLRVSKNR